MRITLTEATAAKTLPQLINEFINRKKADGLRDRTLRDYYKELSKFAATTSSLDDNDLRHAVVNYFAAIPDTSAAIYNTPTSTPHSRPALLTAGWAAAFPPTTRTSATLSSTMLHTTT